MTNDLEQKLAEKEQEIKEKEEQIEELFAKLAIEKFGISKFQYNDELINHYTGFPSYDSFILFYNNIRPTAETMISAYYFQSEEAGNRGRPKAMDLIDEAFMFLCRLNCAFTLEDLAVRFSIHKSTVSRKLISWANYLYIFLGSINIWANHVKIKEHMSQEYHKYFPNIRIIIDCTELYTETPSSLVLQSQTYSTYKSHNTWKGLVGIAPNGALTFVSSLYSGSMSDQEITKMSGLLELLKPGDQIMADKGFILNELLENTGISIVTPDFLASDGQFTKEQVEHNQRIARLRVHVERHIKKVRECSIFKPNIPLSCVGSINQLWAIANLLTLFKRPIIKKSY